MDKPTHVRQHIVVAGGGFAGLAAALELEKLKERRDDFNVTLIEKNSYHTFHALLYEVATARETFSSEDIASIEHGVYVHLNSLDGVSLKRPINVVQAEITNIDLSNRRIEFGNQPPMDYDQLVMALGSEVNHFGIPGLREHSISLKELTDAITIHARLQTLLSQSERLKQPVRILVGGAGISGIETVSELQNYVVSRCKEKGNDPKLIDVQLLEAAPTVLPGFPSWIQAAVAKRLTSLGVTMKTAEPIIGVTRETVELEGGENIPYNLFIWSGGIKAHRLIDGLGVECAGKEQVCVDQYLRVPGYPEVSAVGDAIYFVDPDSNRPVPQVAQLAIAQGQYVADRIVRSLHGRVVVPYRPNHAGFVFPVGGRWAISTAFGIKLTGWLAWVVRKLVDLKYFLHVMSWRSAWRVFWKGERVYLGND